MPDNQDPEKKASGSLFSLIKTKAGSGESTGSNRPKTSIGKAIHAYRKHSEIRRDYEFMPATIEALERPPAPFPRAMLIIIVIFAAIVIAWASISKMDIVVSAVGVIVPKGKVKVIQPLEPGIVKAIHMRDGQIVKKGELLISMDNTDTQADIDTTKEELAVTELVVLRLEAELNNNPSLFSSPKEADEKGGMLQQRLLEKSITTQKERLITLDKEIQRCNAERDSIRSDLERLTESLPLSRSLFDKKKVLEERKLISNTELLQAQIKINDDHHNLLTAKDRLLEVEARLQRAKEEKELAKAEYHRDLLRQLTEAKNKKDQLYHQLAKAENRHTHMELRAPADGIVQQLAINTVGGVVTTAQPLLVIVPTDGGFEVEAKVLDKDIGFLTRDQEVSVKVTAYPFIRYGDLTGKIEWVARDAVIDKELGPSYPVRVTLQSYELPNAVYGHRGIITPGMTVTADVKVGQRRVIEYFLGPIMRYKDESLREI